MIQSADTVVFILSPERCAWEVDRAAELGKRVIPVVGKPVPEAEVPERLRRLNYIFFHEGQSFAQPLAELATALRQDVDWIREHTRLGEAAACWQARTRASGAADDLLLRGDELTGATAWATQRKDNAPEITPLLRSFLAASDDRASTRQNEERQRLAERERLVTDDLRSYGAAAPRSRHRTAASARAMEQQSGREFASAHPTAGAQDATFQERSVCAEVPLSPRRRLQHFHVQRHLMSARSHRVLRTAAMSTWREVISVA